MNILFLIGNGFDLNLGMATRYKDFYKFYKNVESQSSIIESLKKEIGGNIENWSDLEFELGKYTKNLKSENEFTEIYEDLCDRLAEYLEEKEKNFDFNKIDGKKLYDYFIFPENSLLQADKVTLNAFRNKWTNSQWNIYAITFNYTQSLEKLMEYNGTKINIGKNVNSSIPIILQKIEHIHGYINDRMVMGVNDTSQISNHEFQKNQKVLVDLVKNNCNQAQKHLVDVWCKDIIQKANLICIFGSSIGDTDNMWWELIGERLKNDCFLIIFEKGEVIPPRRPQRKALAEIEKKNYFLNKTKLKEEEKKIVASKIIIGINTNMFDLKLKK
ncbi:bacteriophage abortive infection AbiH family protein [Dolichospermum sp. ST_sed3]|nr:bacteriophage abortive infection AbiH family protein [Dolichospermum sp. ST_sed3]